MESKALGLAPIKALLFYPQGELRPEASQHLHGDSPVLELGKSPPVIMATGPRKGWVTELQAAWLSGY